MVVVSASRDESGLESRGEAHYIEADHTVIKVHRLLHIAHMQVNMSQARFRRNGLIQRIILFQVAKQGLHIQRFAAIARCSVRSGARRKTRSPYSTCRPRGTRRTARSRCPLDH